MKPKTALTIIMILSILGLLFSAYFAYYDTWGGGCQEAVIACPEGSSDIMSDTPICLYGVIINLLTLIFSIAGLVASKDKSTTPTVKPKVPKTDSTM